MVPAQGLRTIPGRQSAALPSNGCGRRFLRRRAGLRRFAFLGTHWCYEAVAELEMWLGFASLPRATQRQLPRPPKRKRGLLLRRRPRFAPPGPIGRGFSFSAGRAPLPPCAPPLPQGRRTPLPAPPRHTRARQRIQPPSDRHVGLVPRERPAGTWARHHHSERRKGDRRISRGSTSCMASGAAWSRCRGIGGAGKRKRDLAGSVRSRSRKRPWVGVRRDHPSDRRAHAEAHREAGAQRQRIGRGRGAARHPHHVQIVERPRTGAACREARRPPELDYAHWPRRVEIVPRSRQGWYEKGWGPAAPGGGAPTPGNPWSMTKPTTTSSSTLNKTPQEY